MPDLLVRGVDDDLLQALNKRAGAKGRSPIQNLAFSRALTIGELRRGVELVRQRGDQPRAQLLEQRAIRSLARSQGPLGRRLFANKPHQGCQATLKTEPLPTSITEPPLTPGGRLFSASFRLGLARGWFGACSSFS
jgi:hypothetical protein